MRANGAIALVAIQGRITIDSSGEMRRKLLDALRAKPNPLSGGYAEGREAERKRFGHDQKEASPAWCDAAFLPVHFDSF